jgi:hypothetical protein
MKNLIAITFIISVIGLTSCQECRDCQSTSTVNLNIEYFELDTNGVYQVTSTNSFTFNGTGSIEASLLPNDTLLDVDSMLSISTSPVLTQELCGQTLKDYNNSAINFEQISGDTIGGLFKFSWTENWECQ